MDNFFLRQVATENLFHHEAVFSNVTIIVRMWVVRNPDQHVARFVNLTPAVPRRIPLS